MKQVFTFVLSVFVVSTTTVLNCQGGNPGFRGLGFLMKGTRESQAWDVTLHDNLIVGSSGYNEPLLNWHHQGRPAMWSGNPNTSWRVIELSTLPYPGPGGPGGQAMGISDDGSSIVGYSYIQANGEDGYNAVLWKQNENCDLKTLQTLDGYKFSRAVSTTKNGSVIVGYSMQTPSGSTPFRVGCYWNGNGTGTPTALQMNLPDAVPETTWPVKISSDANTIVGIIRVNIPPDPMLMRPVIWVRDQVTFKYLPQYLPLLTGTKEGMANDVSGNGSIIIGCYKDTDGNLQPCKWVLSTNGYQPETIPNLPSGGVMGSAAAISENGEIITGYVTVIVGTDYIPTPWIWSLQNGTRKLTDALKSENISRQNSWTNLQPMGISADGHTIVGFGTDPAKHEEGWIATLNNP